MAMANMNLTGVFVTKLWPVQALACGGGGGDGGDGGDGGGGGATKTIISPTFSNFGDIIIWCSIIIYISGSLFILDNDNALYIIILKYTPNI